MFLIFLNLITAIIFKDSSSNSFLSGLNGEILLYSSEYALDFRLEDTNPVSLAVVLSVGTKALYSEKNSRKLDLKNLNRNDPTQFFKLVLVSNGGYVIQHRDLCVGNVEGNKVALINCQDIKNVISFFKSEFIDGNEPHIDGRGMVLPEDIGFLKTAPQVGHYY